MPQTPKVPRSLLLRASRPDTPAQGTGPRLLTRSTLETRRAARARRISERTGAERPA